MSTDTLIEKLERADTLCGRDQFETKEILQEIIAELRQAASSEIRVIEPGESDYTKMSPAELTKALGMDGRKWSQAFCQITGFKDRDWALTWFCNAVMAGYDEACRRCAKANAIEREAGKRLLDEFLEKPDIAEQWEEFKRDNGQFGAGA